MSDSRDHSLVQIAFYAALIAVLGLLPPFAIPFLGGSIRELARSVLGLPVDLQPTIEKLTGEKLFLDGLVSVWQVARD